MKAGNQIIVIGKHPWAGSKGVLISHGPYGLSFLKLTGWLVRLDNGTECYAQDGELKLTK